MCIVAASGSLLDLKDVENASRAFGHAMRLAPDDCNVVVNDALCGHLTGNETLAVESYRKLLSLIENEPNVPNEVSKYKVVRGWIL